VRLRALDDADATAVRFSSVHRFKGLEADAVVLCELAAGAGRLGAVLRYIGGTRAKHWLAVCAYEGGA
jgi:ATP-dependent exoDNAse (exonuclease V) beta subunit